MSEMTPEKLRELPGTPTVPSSVLDAFASAWEADRAQATVVLRAYNLARTEILNLRDAIDGKTHLREAGRAAEEKT